MATVATNGTILRLWLLIMVSLGVFVYLYFRRTKEGFQAKPLEAQYKEYVDLSAYTEVETPDVLFVARGDPDGPSNPYDANVFQAPYTKRIIVHVPPRIAPRCSSPPAPAGTAPAPATCKPDSTEKEYTVAQIMTDWNTFERNFKSFIDSQYNGDRDEARRAILKEGRATLFKKYPLGLAAYALIKYKGDVEKAREAVLFDTATLMAEKESVGDATRAALQRVALGDSPNTTPANQKFSFRLASYALAKFKGNIFEARQALLSNSAQLNQERIELDYNSILAQQDISGASTLLFSVVYPGPKDVFQTQFPKQLSAYALAMYELDAKKAREALFSNYNAIQAEMQSKLYSPVEKAAWDTKGSRAMTCERLSNLTNYFNARKAGLGDSIKDIAAAADSMTKAKTLENKRFQYKFEQLCLPLFKQDAAALPANQQKLYFHCKMLASVDPYLYPMVRQLENVGGALGTFTVDFQTVVDEFDKLRQLIGCKDSTSLPALAMKGSGEDAQLIEFGEDNNGYTNAYSLSNALQELSPYYIAPEVLDFVTKYLLGVTEFDEASMDINRYLDTTEENNKLVYGIVTDLASKQK